MEHIHKNTILLRRNKVYCLVGRPNIKSVVAGYPHTFAGGDKVRAASWSDAAKMEAHHGPCVAGTRQRRLSSRRRVGCRHDGRELATLPEKGRSSLSFDLKHARVDKRAMLLIIRRVQLPYAYAHKNKSTFFV